MTFSELPLILFTLLSQMAIGATFFAAYRSSKNPYELHAHLEWTLITTLIGFAVLASIFHLGHPFSAPRALSNLMNAWLSREILSVAIFGILCFACYLTKGNLNLTIGTAIVGFITLTIQSFTYSPVSMPALSNVIIPFCIFLLTGITLGAFIEQWFATEVSLNFLPWGRLALFVLTLVLLAAPCIWSTGELAVKETAVLWFTSPLYWAAILFNVLATVGLALKLFPTYVHFVLILVSAFFIRVLFFNNVAHTAWLIGY